MNRQTRLASATALLALATVSFGSASGAQDAGAPPPLPAPGRMVDIGGWRLHLNCTGQARDSQPIVILEPGIGDFSVEWSLVQPGVAGFARVCAYDRAGDGWSDLGPHPRTMQQDVYELHTLLERAGERAPYVLVGQSFGGVVVRLYHTTYPNQVAGMMLVDAGRLDPWRFINGELVKLPETATGRPVPPVQLSNPFRESNLPPGPRAQIEAGARQAAPRANEPPRDKLPADAQRMRTWALAQVKHYLAYANPFEAEELALMIADAKKKEYPLGDTPLIVLTAGMTEYGPAEQAMEDDRRKSQAAMATISRNGKQIIAQRSGHHIQIDDPGLVIDAIRELLASTRKR